MKNYEMYIVQSTVALQIATAIFVVNEIVLTLLSTFVREHEPVKRHYIIPVKLRMYDQS